MGFLDRLFGNERNAPQPRPGVPYVASEDEQALERYRYMMKTAPPETIEQAHQEAFARLTPEQRQRVLEELARSAPANERAAVEATSSEDPRAMARVATRAEVRQPGVMERTLGGTGAGGMGMAGSLLSSFAAGFVGSMVAQSFFSAIGGFGGEDTGGEHASDEATAQNDAEPDGIVEDNGGYSDFGDGGDFEV
jgi:hypothetical protein